MNKKTGIISIWIVLFFLVINSDGRKLTKSETPIIINQIGYEIYGPKTALYQSDKNHSAAQFTIVDETNNVVFTGDIVDVGPVEEWGVVSYSTMDFSEFRTIGEFRIKVGTDESYPFEIKENCIFSTTINPVFSCLEKMRSWEDDDAVPLYGSNETIDIHGGYKEASGDDAKHISHLQFSNFLPTNEIPECVWGLLTAYEYNSANFESANLTNTILDEAAFGADYLNRACSDEGYFYSTVFDGWGSTERTVCAYISETGGDWDMTDNYQTAFREGGGFSIAALAKASMMKIQGDYTSAQYLATAEKAYAHIKENNSQYVDDGKENFLDELEAGLASIELYRATNKEEYKSEADLWIDKIINRQTTEGYFYCDDAQQRPYYHAENEGLLLMVLSTYLKIEDNNTDRIKEAITKNIDWYFTITEDVTNPFNYIRMYSRSYIGNSYGRAQSSFFMPHDNESGYWWQGENSRLGSMAAALLISAKTLNPNFRISTDSLSRLAMSQIDWILGKNPFHYCMLLGSGSFDYPVGPEGGIDGGICNGLAAADDDGGIYFYDNWRSSEQWLPHGANYLFAISIVSSLLGEPTDIKENAGNKKTEALDLIIHKHHNTVSISLNHGNKHDGILRVYNLQGKRIVTVPVTSNRNFITIDTRIFAKGLQVFEFIVGNNKVIHTWVNSK